MKQFNLSLTRAKFESLISDLVNEAVSHIDTVLKESGKNKNDIKEIVMVGGSIRIPLMQEKVKSFFNNKELNKSVNPDEVVAVGAAIQGAVLKGDVKDVLLLDVAPLSIGIETSGSIMTKMVEKGTTIPVKKTQIFSTYEDNQNAVDIRVGQGESELFQSNKILGNFRLDGIPAARRGTPQIEISFDIDANGILTVTALEKGSGKKQNITITGSSGLSKEEIDKMVHDAEQDNIKNKNKVDAIKKRNELDSLVYQIKDASKEQNIDTSSVPGLDDILIKGEQLVKGQSEDKSEIENTISKLNDLFNSLKNMSSNCSGGNCSAGKKNEDVIDAEVE
jgi:molecular chaperone DnaK